MPNYGPYEVRGAKLREADERSALMNVVGRIVPVNMARKAFLALTIIVRVAVSLSARRQLSMSLRLGLSQHVAVVLG